MRFHFWAYAEKFFYIILILFCIIYDSLWNIFSWDVWLSHNNFISKSIERGRIGIFILVFNILSSKRMVKTWLPINILFHAKKKNDTINQILFKFTPPHLVATYFINWNLIQLPGECVESQVKVGSQNTHKFRTYTHSLLGGRGRFLAK